ncbi:hypothetical protein I5V61_06545 [Stenotrophomonas maltophilia]|uniref:hypothetical protein n=1 Tax=Stenotrophomonas TaxID=40323 RepID=UPI0018D2D05B|nr:hypothetical protein [Stenotrophomonas sp. SMYL86]MBH1851921.1 hypothetical protein [Stenotrophomonas maltophilia]
MSRFEWIAWGIALVLIIFGLWLVDHSFVGALLSIGMALLAMIWSIVSPHPKVDAGN